MEVFNILVDGTLLSASLAACFYCILLSRRVRRLANADQGVGKGIADMTSAVERLNGSLDQTRKAAKTESDVLAARLAEARQLVEHTGQLTAVGSDQAEELAERLEEVRVALRAMERFSAGSRAAPAAGEAEPEPLVETSVPEGAEPQAEVSAGGADRGGAVENGVLALNTAGEAIDLVDDPPSHAERAEEPLELTEHLQPEKPGVDDDTSMMAMLDALILEDLTDLNTVQPMTEIAIRNPAPAFQ